MSKEQKTLDEAVAATLTSLPEDTAVAPTVASLPEDAAVAPTVASLPEDAAVAPTLADRPDNKVQSARVTVPFSDEDTHGGSTGLRFGRFVASEKLGVGGMGTVYAATDPDLERKVAIKALHHSRATGKAQTRFLREAQAMAQLSHPNVITVHEVGTRQGQVYVVMEHVDGGTLRTWATGRPWREVLDAYLKAGEGLIAAHEMGLVHRDFKPDNVLVHKDGRVLVTDFGLVGLADETTLSSSSLPRVKDTEDQDEDTKDEQLTGTTQDTKDEQLTRTAQDTEDGDQGPTGRPSKSSKLAIALTQTGEVMGTPIYMAPEQHAGQRVDARADQYAFCVSVYEALYGVRPFDGKTYFELVDRLTKGKREPPPAKSDVPTWIEQVLVRGLAGEPDARYPDLRQLLDALEGRPPRKRGRWIMGGAALLVLSGALAAALFAHSGVNCDAPSEALRSSWNNNVRAGLRREFASSGQLGAQVVSSLDSYAQRWKAQRRHSCEATHIKGEQSMQLLDRQILCLDERLARFAALTTALHKEGAQAAQLALPLVSRLPAISACARSSTEVQGLVAQAEVNLKLGRIAKARKEIDAALVGAKELRYLPVLLDATHWSAMIAANEGKSERAAELLRQVIVDAGKAQLHDYEANALLSLIYQLGHEAGHYEAALSLSTSAEVVIERAGGGARLRGRLAGNLGLVLLSKGDYRGAQTQLEESVKQLKEAYGAQHLEVAIARNNLALVLERAGHPRDALALLKDVLTLRESQLGKAHPRVATTLNDMGNCSLDLGKLDDAEAQLRRALEIRHKVLGPAHKRTLSTLNNLAIVLSQQGKVQKAEALARR
ncbi:MAG: serine/threonine protein kinase, partial [Deltaproteobacteria bacterium]|nr:serine/threonine protein kinase [Deltaproteobacteria bacterium]